ncbi:pimeloyl-ACP methyl ester carboxylesterase [Crossiella equi]|uniref:Pimeloyl-ACP methyl ester carboxylesterase n=1 Tax=Crossiella equi TaxID=130796 RepID=A0ABS5ASX4_9PSEU|nr:alpha/beta fold hydrolase [Crossiella equi]MBP2478780.1 pimeloyl-ACP methyl ester carboxylesterase [Crossiella equi]
MAAKLVTAVLTTAVVLPLLGGATTAQAAPALDWKPCKDLAAHWPVPDDTRSECTLVAVPVDHAAPDGRKIQLAVSRVRATDAAKHRGVVLVNPGGPGGAGTTMPFSLAGSGSTVAGINTDHDLIGFDPRGTGYSYRPDCDTAGRGRTAADSGLSEKDRWELNLKHDAEVRDRCARVDPEFTASLSTATIAKDMDAIRVALGEKRIGYYGVSWGTALGASYRTQFDGNVDRMLLDSVMSSTFDLTYMADSTAAAYENNFHSFAAWLARYDTHYAFGTTEPEVVKTITDLRALLTGNPREVGSGPSKVTLDGETVQYLAVSARHRWPSAARDLKTLREGGVPDRARAAAGAASARAAAPAAGTGYDQPFLPMSRFLYASVICNDSESTRDLGTAWANRDKRIAKQPFGGSVPGFDGICTGWQLPSRPWRFTQGQSPLQLVGHTYEAVTPIGWAHRMQGKTGGALFAIEDDRHGSLNDLPCGSRAAEFFTSAKTSTESCPGAPVPSPLTDDEPKPSVALDPVAPYVPDAERV